jgi:hypothetical protein
MGTTDHASFAHFERNSPAQYALKQTAAGPTYINTPASGHIRFTVNDGNSGAEKMRITSAGNVGIGVSAPDANLHVEGNVYVSSNLTVGGNVVAGYLYGDGSNISGISSTLQAITDSGPGANVTSNTVQFSNATTGFVTTANVEVGGELTVSGNVAVDTDTLFIDSVNDRVGVGTNSPNEPLDIYGAGMRIHHLGGEPKIDFLRGGTNRTPSGALNTFGAANYTDWRIGASGANLKFQQQYIGANSGNIIDVMTMNYGTGNVGVGTDAPGTALEVFSTSGTQMTLRSNSRYSTIFAVDDTGSSFFGNDRGNIRFVAGGDTSGTGASEKMRILANGNVGVGTNAPDVKLHVDGGDLTVSGVAKFQNIYYFARASLSGNFQNSGSATYINVHQRSNGGLVSTDSGTKIQLNTSDANGVYMVWCSVSIKTDSGQGRGFEVSLVKGNTVFASTRCNINHITSSTYTQIVCSGLIDLTSGNKVYHQTASGFDVHAPDTNFYMYRISS